MSIFNPMQVQAALQNPVQFPDPRLQQYAAGQPPNPQVPPGPFGPAGLELTSRGAQRQAAANTAQMQSDPSKSPTIFQRKDAELAQAQQAMQQEKQQLGLMAALMAKKAQDMQAREQGIAALPMRSDMFTAMDGGIVFSGGGGVQRFQVGGNLETNPEFGGSMPGPEELDVLGAARRFVDQNPSVIRRTPAPPKAASKPSSSATPSAPRPKASSPAAAASGISSLAALMEQLKPFERQIDTSQSDKITQDYVALTNQVAAMIEAGLLSEEKGREIIEAKKAEMAAQYAEYTQGRDARIEKARAAIEGQAPTFQNRLGRGLGAIAQMDPRNLRVYQAALALAAGASDVDKEYANRQREAAKYLADAEERAALAALAEKRGQVIAGETARDKGQERLTQQMQTRVGVLEAQQKGLGALRDQAVRKETGDQALNRDNYTAAVTLLQELVREGGRDNRAREAIAAANIRNAAKSGVPSGVQTAIVNDILQRFRNPYDPLVIQAVGKIDPGAAKILSLGRKAAEDQPGYPKALEAVDRAKQEALRSALGVALDYSDLPNQSE